MGVGCMQKRAMHHGIKREDEIGFAQGVKSDGLVFVAAQVSHNERGELVGKDDFSAQLKQCYLNLKGVLSTYGLGMSYVMLETIYVKDGVEIDGMGAIRDEFYKDKKMVATTVVRVSGLIEEEYLVGIQCVAKLS